MNSTMFSVKRGFLRAVNFGRKVLAPYGFALTPARFDILYLLRKGWRHQSAVWRILGLHPSTVCKMMIRLEDLGLVFRNTDPDNHREVVVKLAPDGERALAVATAGLVETGALEGFMGDVVAGLHRRRDVSVLNLEEGLLRMRRMLLDTARLLYVFDPEEWPRDGALLEWPRGVQRSPR